MTTGEVVALKDRIARVALDSGGDVYFDPTHRSVTHGSLFLIGDRVSIRFSRDNSRVISIVPLDFSPDFETSLPIRLELVINQIFRTPKGDRKLAWGIGGLWVWTPGRQRPWYVCSAGVEHERWWRRHTPGGSYPKELRCAEHEVTEKIAPDLTVI